MRTSAVYNADVVVAVVISALTVRGTVAAVRHISGGLTVRVSGRTNRVLASRTLGLAGFGPITCDDEHGVLHIAPREDPT